MTEINTARSFLSELWRALVSLPQPVQKTPGFCFRPLLSAQEPRRAFQNHISQCRARVNMDRKVRLESAERDFPE